MLDYLVQGEGGVEGRERDQQTPADGGTEVGHVDVAKQENLGPRGSVLEFGCVETAKRLQ